MAESKSSTLQKWAEYLNISENRKSQNSQISKIAHFRNRTSQESHISESHISRKYAHLRKSDIWKKSQNSESRTQCAIFLKCATFWSVRLSEVCNFAEMYDFLKCVIFEMCEFRDVWFSELCGSSTAHWSVQLFDSAIDIYLEMPLAISATSVARTSYTLC